jgi:hypothetical protein
MCLIPSPKTPTPAKAPPAPDPLTLDIGDESTDRKTLNKKKLGPRSLLIPLSPTMKTGSGLGIPTGGEV